MKNLFNFKIAILLLITVISGCRMFGKSGQENYLEKENAKNAIEKVKGKIGKSFKVSEIVIEENEIRMQVQDPNNPKNLDEYKIVNGYRQRTKSDQAQYYAARPRKQHFSF